MSTDTVLPDNKVYEHSKKMFPHAATSWPTNTFTLFKKYIESKINTTEFYNISTFLTLIVSQVTVEKSKNKSDCKEVHVTESNIKM